MVPEQFEASEVDWERARHQHDRMSLIYALLGGAVVSLLCVPAVLLAGAVASGVAQALLSAVILAVLFAPIVVVILRSDTNAKRASDQAITALERELRGAVRTSEHERRLANALEMAEGEPAVLEVIERALAATIPSAPVEPASR